MESHVITFQNYGGCSIDERVIAAENMISFRTNLAPVQQSQPHVLEVRVPIYYTPVPKLKNYLLF